MFRRRSLFDILAISIVFVSTCFGADEEGNAESQPTSQADEYEEQGLKPMILDPSDIFSDERRVLHRLTTGEYPFRRGLFIDDVVIKSRQVKLESGKKVSLVWGRPKNVKIAPAVFIIDVESAALSNAPAPLFFNRRNQRRKELEAKYLLTSPLAAISLDMDLSLPTRSERTSAPSGRLGKKIGSICSTRFETSRRWKTAVSSSCRRRSMPIFQST